MAVKEVKPRRVLLVSTRRMMLASMPGREETDVSTGIVENVLKWETYEVETRADGDWHRLAGHRLWKRGALPDGQVGRLYHCSVPYSEQNEAALQAAAEAFDRLAWGVLLSCKFERNAVRSRPGCRAPRRFAAAVRRRVGALVVGWRARFAW